MPPPPTPTLLISTDRWWYIFALSSSRTIWLFVKNVNIESLCKKSRSGWSSFEKNLRFRQYSVAENLENFFWREWPDEIWGWDTFRVKKASSSTIWGASHAVDSLNWNWNVGVQHSGGLSERKRPRRNLRHSISVFVVKTTSGYIWKMALAAHVCLLFKGQSTGGQRVFTLL